MIIRIKNFIIGRLKPVAYFFNTARLVFGELRSAYSFKICDRFVGARLVLKGYSSVAKGITNTCDQNLEKFVVNDVHIYTPINAFKKGELGYLYTEVFSDRLINPHAYEYGPVALSAGDVVVDAGACEGFFSCYALQKKVGQIYLFEPVQSLCHGLRKTFEKEVAEQRAFIIDKGISYKSGSEKFIQDNQYICMSRCDSQGSALIELLSLDDFVINNEIKKLDFIKMDVEGAEVDAIKGAENTIKMLRPKLSIAVYHNYENAFLIRDLVKNYCSDYKVFFGGCYMYEKPYRPYMLYATV